MIHICDKSCFHIKARDIETIKWIALGKSNGDIARLQGRAEQTIKNSLTPLFVEMGATNRTGLVFAALKAGLLSLEDL